MLTLLATLERKHAFETCLYDLYKMKSYLLCVRCVLILNLWWFSLTRSEDTPIVLPVVSASENASAESVDKDVKNAESDKGAHPVRDLEPSVGFSEKTDDHEDTFSQKVFAEATSQNSGVANEITSNGSPVVLTLADVATAELQQRAIIPSQNENSQATKNQTESQTEDFKPDQPKSETNVSQHTDRVEALDLKENLTEEIPSFSEWSQKQLEEAEKNKELSNASAQANANGKAKLRWKNYASLDCGAKVVAANPEAVSSSAILSPSRDEYKLNTCTSRIWFVVELCEAIQAKKIHLANFELFSSSPKDFVVSVGDRFPSREWSIVGQFTAKDERDVQSFDLHPHLFGKFIKVEMKSHYGSEHYCPISLFRVFGTSEFEVLQKEDPVHADRLEDEDDDDDDDGETLDLENGDSSKNLFSSATDAVISMVKKAAEVLGNKGNHSNQTETLINASVRAVPLAKACTSPSHLVVCDNCSAALFGQVYELLSCHGGQIRAFLNIPFIAGALVNSNICQRFGFDFCKLVDSMDSRSKCVEAFFPIRILSAMCNEVAVALNKIVLNVTSDYVNDTGTATDEEELVNIETSEAHVITPETKTEPEVTDALVLEVTEAVTKSTCSTDLSYTSQIKPTKTLTADLDLKGSHTEADEVGGDGLKQIVEAVDVVQSNVSEKIEEGISAEIEQSDKLGEVETVTETVENLDDPLEHFIEFNGDGQHPPTAQATATTTPQVQKESVFLRLSNRIKALERNMSLSGQYLEELSKRYKKQVEEIQKLLDKTIANMAEENRKKDEQNRVLEERLAALTATVESLLIDRNSWSATLYYVAISSIVTFIIIFSCVRIPEPRAPFPQKLELKRRKSIDVVGHPPPQKKKRRPSDQALKIVQSMERDHFKKKKKKKSQPLQRSNSISIPGEDGFHEVTPTWNRQKSASPYATVDWVEGKHIEDVPFVLEESEHSSLEPLLVTEAPHYMKTAQMSRSVRVNGDVLTKKSVSVDETSRQNAAINGSLSLKDETLKKERKGLKKIFRKVF